MKLSYGSHSFLLQAASQWLELRLQLLGCGVVAGVAVIAVGDLLFPTNFVIVSQEHLGHQNSSAPPFLGSFSFITSLFVLAML